MTLQIAIRLHEATDEDFIYSTWMKSFRDNSYARAVPTQLYNIGQRKRINKILSKEGVNVLIACDAETPELIYGYAVMERTPDVLHYVYVKSAYRKLGIAKALLIDFLDNSVLYTHKGDIVIERLLRDDPTYNQWVYNPYLLEDKQ